LLRGESRTARLRVKTKQHRTRVLRVETVAHHTRPQPASGAEFCDFVEQTVVRVEEKRKLRREIINFQASGYGCVNVRDGVRESESDFLHGGRACFANVIA